jgi:pimeloyl-ACP methyl ester carboxylesterase
MNQPTVPTTSAATVPMAHRVKGEGSPLFLLAGTGYNGSTWGDRMVNLLAEHHTVITFDYRGTGETPGTDDDYTTRLFAADVIRLIDDLGMGPVHVLGHSMGGRVGQWVAIDGPDRVRSLVMAASGPGEFRPGRTPVTGIPVAQAEQLIELGYEGFMRRQITSTFFTPEYVAAHQDVVDWLIAAYWNGRPDLHNYLKHIAARQSHLTVEHLSKITQRTLVLVGDHDTHVGGTGSHLEQSEYLARTLANAELSIVPGGSHGYFWSHTDDSIGRVIRFLASAG